MGYPLRALIILCSFAISFGHTQAKELDAIVLQGTDTNVIKIDFTERYLLEDKYPDINQVNKNKKISSSLSKNFGPLKLGLKLNPLGNRGSTLRFDLDLMQTYAILSRSEKLSDVTHAFKPDPQQELISSEIKHGIFTVISAVPRGIAQLAHNSDQPL